MASYLLDETDHLNIIEAKLPCIAVAFEDQIRAVSKVYLKSLWEIKVKHMEEIRKKEYAKTPLKLVIDFLAPAIISGYESEHPRTDGRSSVDDYLIERNLLAKSNISDALVLVDYLGYEDILAYLCRFTQSRIDVAVKYGDRLARGSTLVHKTRMDGTPLPPYPPTMENLASLPFPTWFYKEPF